MISLLIRLSVGSPGDMDAAVQYAHSGLKQLKYPMTVLHALMMIGCMKG